LYVEIVLRVEMDVREDRVVEKEVRGVEGVERDSSKCGG
jgi:hypothetical protein